MQFGDESGVEAVVNKEVYKRCFEDQKRLGDRGLDTAYLTRALINLSNYKTAYINDTNRPWGVVSKRDKQEFFQLRA